MPKNVRPTISCQQDLFIREPRQTGGDGGGIGFTTVYASSAVPSFRAGGCYLCLNDIIAFPPARVLPDGKTRIRHLARIGLLPDSWDGHTTHYVMNEA